MLKYFCLLLFSWMLGILSNKQKHDNNASVVISKLLGDCNNLELFTIRSKEELGSMIVLSTVQCTHIVRYVTYVPRANNISVVHKANSVIPCPRLVISS